MKGIGEDGRGGSSWRREGEERGRAMSVIQINEKYERETQTIPTQTLKVLHVCGCRCTIIMMETRGRVTYVSQ